MKDIGIELPGPGTIYLISCSRDPPLDCSSPSAQASSTTREEPMQFESMGLTPEESQRCFHHGLCLCCGKAASVLQSSLASGGALVSTTPVYPYYPRILLRGRVNLKTSSFSVQALLDSVADDSFIDSQYVYRAGIPTEIV